MSEKYRCRLCGHNTARWGQDVCRSCWELTIQVEIHLETIKKIIAELEEENVRSKKNNSI